MFNSFLNHIAFNILTYGQMLKWGYYEISLNEIINEVSVKRIVNEVRVNGVSVTEIVNVVSINWGECEWLSVNEIVIEVKICVKKVDVSEFVNEVNVKETTVNNFKFKLSLTFCLVRSL